MKRLSKKEQERKLQEIRERLQTKVTPFEDCSEVARRARVERAREDFGFFCRTYFPHYFDTELALFHHELVALMEVRGEPVAVAAPRGHGKSTITTLAKPLRDIVFKARWLIVLIGADLYTATLQTAAIRLELEENERLRADFGNLADVAGDCWAEGHFKAVNGVMVVARGRGQKLRGIKNGPHRPDIVILDDPEDDEQAESPWRVRKFLRYVQRAVVPALCRGGTWSLFWVGTVLSRRSGLAQVLDERNAEFAVWRRKRYRALQEDGTALCPAIHSVEGLQRLKAQIGSVAFNAELQNDPHDEEGLFREEWLTTYEPAHVAHELAAGMTVLALDPSVYAGKSTDYKALIVVTRHPRTAHVYVREAWIRKASIDGMIEAAYDLAERWNVQAVVVEIQAFAALLMREFAAVAARKGRHLPLVPVTQHLSKEIRITGLSPLHERGVIRYPAGFPGDLEVLKEQLLAYPSRVVHDDGPDGLEMAVRRLEGTAVKLEYKPLVVRRFAQLSPDEERRLDVDRGGSRPRSAF